MAIYKSTLKYKVKYKYSIIKIFSLKKIIIVITSTQDREL
jgi:hypothetical protein